MRTTLMAVCCLVALLFVPISAVPARVVYRGCHDGVLRPAVTDPGCDWDGARDGACTFAFFCLEVCSTPPPGSPTLGGQVVVPVGHRRIVKRTALPTIRVTRYVLRCLRSRMMTPPPASSAATGASIGR
jgi:hypothetical protein